MRKAGYAPEQIVVAPSVPLSPFPPPPRSAMRDLTSMKDVTIADLDIVNALLRDANEQLRKQCDEQTKTIELLTRLLKQEMEAKENLAKFASALFMQQEGKPLPAKKETRDKYADNLGCGK